MVRVHHEGFYDHAPPNSNVPCTNGSVTYDCDFNSWREGKKWRPTGRLHTQLLRLRSFHTGVVQVTLVDGSARAISDNIDLGVWRSLGTRNGESR